jgi:hypothetical protein
LMVPGDQKGRNRVILHKLSQQRRAK